MFSNQISSGKKICSAFDTRLNTWVTLIAEMQSGKTGTFMFVACESLFRKDENKVNKVVIFSGNREIELYKQTKEQDKFFEDYKSYMISDGISEEESMIHIQICKDSIEVVWGPHLKSYIKVDKTLYIWEESHYGQSQNQEVDKFITRMGISATGTTCEGDFLLSVSATPFSELSDNHYLKQDKWLVSLKPAETYMGVKKMLANGQINVYTNITKQFTQNLNMYDNYGIVRASNKVQQKLIPIAKSKGWEVIPYDNKNKNMELDDILKDKPKSKTIIFIKQMIRMGKVLIKTHVSFVMETSLSQTDTMLQGLLGRMCGYHTHDNIDVYLLEKARYTTVNVYKKGKQVYKVYNKNGKNVRQKVTMRVKMEPNLVKQELERYISFSDGNFKSIPMKGSNLVKETLKDRIPIIPLRIKLDPDPDKKISETIIDAIDRNIVDSKNSPEITSKVCAIARRISVARQHYKMTHIVTDENIEKDHFKLHTKSKDKELYDKTFRDIKQAYQDGIAKCNFGSRYGVAAHVDEIAVFVNKKYMYITAQIPFENVCVPTTTRKEVFCKELQIPELAFGAEFKIPINPLCATDSSVLLSTLTQLSKAGRGFDISRITSNGGQYKGITLSPDVFLSLKGFISKQLLEDGVILNWKMAKGPTTQMVRLSEISWNYI